MTGAQNCVRFLSTITGFKPKICIVGAGPAGFYAAQHLVKKLQNVEVDIYEKLPVPFGLVRYGVAPDHPEVKNVINTFTKTANFPNVRFIGNVELGKDVSMQDLKQAYHLVLLTYGAEENRSLKIRNDTNVIAARKFVGWYNGVPQEKGLEIDLSGRRAIIFGQGNVAIDIARILFTPIDKLKTTDITQHALNALAQSKIEDIYLVGRRGPLQVAFTIKEFREVLNLEGNYDVVWRRDDFKGISEIVPKLARPRKRLTELMLSALTKTGQKPNGLHMVFHRSPLEFRQKSVLLGVNHLEGPEDDFANKKAVLTPQTEEIPCDLILSSIGYKSIQVDDTIRFDFEKGTVQIDGKGCVEKGVYAAGWLATGPVGVILTTMSNAFATAEDMCRDLQESPINCSKPGFEQILQLLNRKNVQIVLWNDWLKIDQVEREAGKQIGKPREKIVDIKEMLNIAAN